MLTQTKTKPKLKLDEMEIIPSKHCLKQLEKRGVSLQRIMYGLRDKIRNLRYYNNFDKELCYRDEECSVFFTIKNKKIIFITVLDKRADICEEAVVI